MKNTLKFCQWGKKWLGGMGYQMFSKSIIGYRWMHLGELQLKM
jgi:hypothetical protein